MTIGEVSPSFDGFEKIYDRSDLDEEGLISRYEILPAGLRPLIDPENLGQENFQVRLARVLANVFVILADLSKSEKEKISLLKREIKEYTNLQAEMTGKKGNVAWQSAIIKVVPLVLSMFSPMSNYGSQLNQFGTVGGDTFSNCFNASYDKRITIAQSKRDVGMQDLQNTNNDVQAKAGTRREFHEVLKEILQLFQTAARSQ